MLVPWTALNGRHPNTSQCAKWTERKRRKMVAEEAREGMYQAFRAYGHLLTMVEEFNYLCHIITASDDEWTAVVGNLQKARKKWERTSRILGREEAYERVSGIFFKAVVRVVLLFGSETWVLTPHMGWMLGGFQHKVAHWLIKKKPTAATWRRMGVPPLGVSDAGGGAVGSGGIYPA